MSSQAAVIAIDGPAGAGKSTVAREVARRLRLAYVDSGATYRAAALKVLRAGVSLEDEEAVERLLAETNIRFAEAQNGIQVLLDEQNVTDAIRSPEVTQTAARVSRLRRVREKLVQLQRSLKTGRGVVMEGRDIGTKVFPDADLKIFLDASSQARAERRLQDDLAKGRQTSLDQTYAEISERDKLDQERKISPLVPASDAIPIDSTKMSVEDVVSHVVELARGKLNLP